jgi:hypothetical protein
LILTFRIINSSGESDRFFELEPARPADKLAWMNPWGCRWLVVIGDCLNLTIRGGEFGLRFLWIDACFWVFLIGSTGIYWGLSESVGILSAAIVNYS